MKEVKSIAIANGNKFNPIQASVVEYQDNPSIKGLVILGPDGQPIGQKLRDITKEPTGFTDPENIIVTYNSIDRTVTLTGNVEAYYKGKKIPELVSGWTSQPHADTNGVFFLHYCDGNFIFDTTPWTFDCLQIAYVQSNGYKIGIRECHGFMQWQTHKEFHETIGTYRTAGGDISGIILNSNVAANRRPDIEALTVYDEDLKTIIPLLNSKKYTHRYLSGAGARTFDTQQDDIIKLNGTVPRYNIFSGGVWSFADIPTSQYAAIFVVGVPVTADSGSQEYRYMFVQPQQFGSLSQIEALTPNSLTHGDSATLVSEFVFFGKIIIRSIGGSWQITKVELLTGTRTSQVSTSGNFLSVVNTDSSLTGNGTAGSPLSINKNWISLVMKRTSEPVLYDTQPTYELFEYTYGTTKYYRKVPTTYTAAEDKFFEDADMTTLITSRALSF